MSNRIVIEPVPWSTFLSAICKYLIESIIALATIVLNGLLMVGFLRLKQCRSAQNLLLINLSFVCIFFSLSCLLSISLSTYFLSINSIQLHLCRSSGFLLILSCHCLMFSYTLVALVRFLSIIYPFNRTLTGVQSVKIYLIVSWTMALLVSTISLIPASVPHIAFQPKAKICFMNQRSPVLYIYFSTGYIIPILLISAMNGITYLSVKRSRQLVALSQNKLSRLNKRNQRNLRLLRQFSLFTIFFIFGWTPFIIVEIFDRKERLSDIIYIYVLILPPICVLIDSCAILNWNKAIHNQVRGLLKRKQTRQDKSTTEHDLHSLGSLRDFWTDRTTAETMVWLQMALLIWLRKENPFFSSMASLFVFIVVR